MSWRLQTLKAPIPADEVNAFLGSLNGAVGSITSVLDVISQALEVVKVLANPATDPFNLIIQAFYDELNNFVNNFFGTGVYMLTASPFNCPGLKHDAFGIPILYPAEAIQKAVASFDDIGDVQRPQFSDTAEVSAIGIMLTATSVPDLTNLLEALNGVFAIPDWAFALKEINRRKEIGTKSIQPDWTSFRLNSIDQMSEFQNGILGLLEVLRGYTTIPDNNIGDLISAIQGKVTVLNGAITDMQNIITLLTRSAGGVYVMSLPQGVGGNARIKAALRDSFLETCKPTSGYTIMTVIVGGGPSLATVEAIRALMV